MRISYVYANKMQNFKEVHLWTVVIVKVEVHITMDSDLDYLEFCKYSST